MPNLIGQTLLNQYRVDTFVASGGMGAVYKVWDLRRNVALAMKVLHADFAEDPSALKYFQREARALEKLRHPNIVPFYGVHLSDQIAFILEQFVDGPALRDVLQKNPRGLSISDALTYMKALCSALGYAHSSGVIHCDIKPGNVMLDSGGQVYLADFGIARHAESSTTTIASAGTPAYMSPEQIRGQPVNPATDVYALGVLLFEMLTGQRPFRGDETETKGNTTAERIRYAHLYLAPPNPSRINPTISQSLAGVTLRALAKTPAERYSTTADFFQDLCRACGISYNQIPDRLSLRGSFAPPPLDVNIPKNDAPPIPPVRKTQTSFIPWVIAGFSCLLVTVVLVLIVSLPVMAPVDTVPPVPLILETDVPPTLIFTPTLLIVPLSTDIAAPMEPPTFIPADTPTPFTPTATEASSPPVAPTSCPGAPPQSVAVGDKVRVCTNSGDPLYVRNNPGLKSKAPFLVRKRAILWIVGGPRCMDNATWWKVTVPIGTSAIWAKNGVAFQTAEEVTGWIREGDYHDPKGDLYFICKEQ